MADVVSTTTTATTSTPSSAPMHDFNYAVGAIGYVFGGLAVVLMFGKGILEFFASIVNWYKSRNKEEQEKDLKFIAPLESRVLSLEESTRTFRPGDRIDQELTRVEQKMTIDLGRVETKVSETLGRLETKLAENTQRVENQSQHDKRNIYQNLEAVEHKLRDHSAKIGDHDQILARMGVQVEGLSVNTQRIERALDKLTDRVDERFDGLNKTITDFLSSDKT